MDKKNWEQEYPRMPEAFHLAVSTAVEENLKKESGKPEKTVGIKGHKKKKYVLLFAAVLMTGAAAALGVTAAREEQKQNPETVFLKELGLENRTNLDPVLQKNIQVTAAETPVYKENTDPELIKSLEKRENNEPVLTIPLVMYDGQRLAIYAEPTEEGKKYSCEAWTLQINGQLIEPIEMDDNLGKQDYYIFQTELEDLDPGQPFEVTIPLQVYGKAKRYENQDLTFTVNTEPAVKKIPDQSFVYDDYSVHITDLTQSLTALQGKVTVEMTKEQREAYENGNIEISSLILRSQDGTFWKQTDGCVRLGEDIEEETTSHRKYNYMMSYPADAAESEKAAPCMEYGFAYQIPEDDPKSVLLSFMGLRKDLPGVGDIPAGEPVPEEVQNSRDTANPENYYGEAITLLLE